MRTNIARKSSEGSDIKKNIRKCIACGARADKAQLLRINKDCAGHISQDGERKAEGRGAYVCKNESCINLANKKRLLSRAFKGSVDFNIELREVE